VDYNGNAVVHQVKDFFVDLCKDAVRENKLSKKDLENFLSSFNYNKFGTLGFSEISK
jgi:hypothetical protein